MTQLPEGFIKRMAARLESELPAFLHSYEEPYRRGIRFNPGKPVAETLRPEGVGEPIPWESTAYQLAPDSRAGMSVLHEAGAWYLQEPSAMAPVAVLAPQPGERVLDLCAAPGGKSTQIAARMQGRGLLVSNEPVPSRAQILSRNLERMGVTNAVCVSAYPDKLAGRWGAAFDAVLVDAPCSGEGMFRRHPETCGEWNEASPAGCAKRQSDILDSAAELVRPGGRLVYSTCTLDTVENEENVAAFLQRHTEFSLMPFCVEGLGECEGMLTLWPHKLCGEGHFAALLHKAGEGEPLRTCESGLPAPDKGMLAAWRSFAPGEAREDLCLLGQTLVSLPEACPDLRGVKVLRAGLHLGELRGKVFLPDHALAVSAPRPALPQVELTETQAADYLTGQELEVDTTAKGFVLACRSGVALGWGKVSDGRMKNHYPKGLRRQVG